MRIRVPRPETRRRVERRIHRCLGAGQSVPHFHQRDRKVRFVYVPVAGEALKHGQPPDLVPALQSRRVRSADRSARRPSRDASEPRAFTSNSSRTVNRTIPGATSASGTSGRRSSGRCRTRRDRTAGIPTSRRSPSARPVQPVRRPTADRLVSHGSPWAGGTSARIGHGRSRTYRSNLVSCVIRTDAPESPRR